jgi:hypothetical protein
MTADLPARASGLLVHVREPLCFPCCCAPPDAHEDVFFE